MTENEGPKSQEEERSFQEDINRNKQPEKLSTPYPNLEQSEGADNEQFIINNSNGNGINPNPLESGNNPEWIDGRRQSEEYLKDADSVKQKKEE